MKNIALSLIVFYSLLSFSQEYKSTALSVISPNKDTLWLLDDNTGRLIAYSWEIETNPSEKKPVILFVERLPIKDSQDFKKYVKDNTPGLDLKRSVKSPSGESVQVEVGFGVEFFRPFYGL